MGRSDHPVTPQTDRQLIGLAELAVLFKTYKQHADWLSNRADFPPPVVELASGRVWDKVAVQSWKRARDHKARQ